MKRHLVGIGGVGMSALAVALKENGDSVCGSDRALRNPNSLQSGNFPLLRSLGIECFPDDGSGIDGDTEEVIVSTAIENDNEALCKARSLGIPVVHRARALSRALSSRKLVAVAGTCGKSTVTAMLGHILSKCGFDPFCVNGANVPGWEGAVLPGKGEYAVAEVDESDKSLVEFKPYAAIITNASADHYSKEEMDEVFDSFIDGIDGPVVDGRAFHPDPVPCPMPGRHNMSNAALAVEMASRLGCDSGAAIKALHSFSGVERRLQRHGDRVFDDYAHNPEKLHAMWTALSESRPGGICAVWRPHGYAPLRKMADALAAMFDETVRVCDRLLLLPVYDAGGTADRSVNSDYLAARMKVCKPVLVADLDDAFEKMSAARDSFATFAVCGARDPGLPVLARRLATAVS